MIGDDWLALLALGDDDDIISVGSSSRSRSRSRSRSYHSFRPPSPESSETDEVQGASSEAEPELIFHDECPPILSDGHIQGQLILPAEYDGPQIGNGLPLIFKHRTACISETLMQIVDGVARGDSFYTGATINPRRGWLGFEGCPGHRWTWSVQIMIGYTAKGLSMEKVAIKLAPAKYGEQCVNKVQDPRGQAPGLNFNYICC